MSSSPVERTAPSVVLLFGESGPVLNETLAVLENSRFEVVRVSTPNGPETVRADVMVIALSGQEKGPEASKLLALAELGLPTVIVAENRTDEELAGWFSVGVADCFLLPLRPALFLHRLNRVVAGRARSREAAFRESLLNGLYNCSPARIGVVEFSGSEIVVRSANQLLADEFDLRLDQLVGSSLNGLELSEDATRELNIWVGWCRESIRLGRSVSFVHQSLRSHRWFSATFEPLNFQADGKSTAVCFFVEDISDKQAAKVLSAESEARFYKVFQIIPVPTAIISLASGRHVDVNAAYTQLLGYAREEIVGRTTNEIRLWARPEQRDAYYRRILEEGMVTDFEASYRTASGDIGECLVSSVMMRVGDQECQLALLQDITQNKRITEQVQQREAWFNAILNATLDGIVAEDNERIVFANRSLARMCGYESATELINRDFSVICEPNEVARLREFSRRRLRGEHAPLTYEFTAKHRDGTLFQLENSVSEFVIDDKKYFIAVMRDVQERKRLEESLRQAQKMEAVGRLAGGIAHDFNNLLNGILGFTRLAIQKVGDQQPVRHYLDAIFTSAERGAALVSKMLAFGKPKAPSRQLVSLKQILSESVFLVRGMIPPTIEIVEDFPDELMLLEADPDQIQQIVVNLCINARDAMVREGHITISARNDHFPENLPEDILSGCGTGHCVTLTIADDGEGMPPDVVRRIFEPFFTTKDIGKGTGLGLSIVHGIVSSHNGTISVESAPGKGTRFDIRLPAIPDVCALPQPHTLTTTFEGRETVLIIEDDPLITGLFSEVLMQYGYRVLTAADGEAGLNVLMKNRKAVSVVILDVMMPRMNGLVCFFKIREIAPKLPVIVSSGYGEESLSAELAARADAFLQKPFLPEALLQALRDVLDRAGRY
jgi:PAS domain S-box-containing protein